MADAKNTHAFEQAGAALIELAGSLWGYFAHLVELGFTRDEALELTKSVQHDLFLTANKPNVQGPEK